ncbi:sodium:solute symporter [Alphaproteobacteria bacterium GH1-50]|uniref:histidine kinase n=1 Tax=Kangsaoukella pontilimi TaxID=2691042 RepID=A0A7C9IRA8_9RHOB|nr:ATP-binding protein [Kangsaoukella pontilimi]MXQ06765.1 sodium:solute symporter [Kangsaoukella pontilimi]
MLSFNALIVVALLYVALLFAVAFWADSRAERGRLGWLRSPLVYTLSLSIYCTAWTFYGAVGNATRSGLEYVTIYLGPTLVLIGWWALLRRLVRIGRTQRITSIADMISSRYGKSNLLGIIVTVLAVVGTTPYIALQLQSVTLSFAVFSPAAAGEGADGLSSIAFWVAVGLVVFTIMFGTRNLDVNERHYGVVTAIALEAIVKLAALIAVGLFVVFAVADGPVDVLERIEASPIADWDLQPDRWATLIFLSAAAFICLPRMFQVIVVENSDERHLATASWAFPLYLFMISLFVLPIAVVGLATLPADANPDLFVLTLPIAFDQSALSMLAFLGGFSSATSMVIVAAIALSTMVSNHIVMPIWLNARKGGATVSGDVRDTVILARRLSIAGVLALGYLYFRLSGGGTALASMGLIAFIGLAQVLPALLGGIFWRGATRVGAAVGLLVGFAVWGWTSFLPSFGDSAIMTASVFSEGPFGIGLLRPTALFGIEGMDPLVHSVFWSMLLNSGAFVLFSLLSFPTPIERIEGATFVNVFRYSESAPGWTGGAAEAEDLLIMAQRIVGPTEAQTLFEAEARLQGNAGYLPEVTPDFLQRLERELAGSVGAATAHAMIAQITGGVSVSVEDLMKVADEAQQILEYSNQLEAKSVELGRTARQLKEANDKLMALSVQKDGFLSQISHELRTPMTSIRSFSEILMGGERMSAEDRQRYSSIIHDEAIRLTRLLDDLLDLSVLENGQVTLNMRHDTVRAVLDRAVAATERPHKAGGIVIHRTPGDEDAPLYTDSDRLAQVFINLIANAEKYCEADAPALTIEVKTVAGRTVVDFTDNGRGIPREAREMIFEKFSRVSDHRAAGGAGLGLAICREIMARLGGTIAYLPGQGGASFRVTLPEAVARAAE